jgi:hypothetical protein
MPRLDLSSNVFTQYGFAATRTGATVDVATDPAGVLTPQVLGATTRIITAVGDFPYPWSSEQEEIEKIGEDLWFPSTRDFIAAVQNSRAAAARKGPVPIVSSSEAFIFLILNQPPGSISRINLVTHGASSSIGMKGRVTAGAVFFDDELDVGTFQQLLEFGIIFKGKHVEWAEVERRFAANAEIVIYACNVGLSESFLQEIADFFLVTVRGFDHALHYEFEAAALDGGAVRRELLTVDGKRNINELTPTVVRRPGPQPKNPFK